MGFPIDGLEFDPELVSFLFVNLIIFYTSLVPKTNSVFVIATNLHCISHSWFFNFLFFLYFWIYLGY